MSKKINYSILSINNRQIYEVKGHYFEIIYRCPEHIPVSDDMVDAMASFADEETKDGNKSFPNDAIPFDIWGEDDYLAY